jgi:DNA polymerase-3 subunit alpha
VVDGKIRFGLAAVKNVGIKAVESVIEDREKHGPYGDLLEFCTRIEGAKVNRRVLEGLIQCGAFDFTGIYRSRLFAGLDDVARFCGANHDPNQLNMFGSLDPNQGEAGGLFELPELDEWEEKEALRREKEALGFYITGHPLAEFKEEIDRLATCAIQDLLGQKDRDHVKVAGVVGNLKIKRTKRGDKMAILSLEDLSGSAEVVIFPEAFTRFSPLLKADDPLLISGIVEIGETTAKVIAQEIVTLEAMRHQAIKALELSLRQEEISREMLEDLRHIVFKYPGQCRLLFKVGPPMGQVVRISAHRRFSVLPSRDLINEVETLTGNKMEEFIL